MSSVVADESRQALRRSGVTCLRQVLTDSELSLLESAFNWSLANPGKLVKPVTPGEPGSFYGDLANPESFDAYHDVNYKTCLPEIISALWQKPDVWFMYEQVFYKTGGADTTTDRTPWHQDISYLPVSGDDLAVVWISFESLSEQESLEFVVGSHHGVMYDGSSFDPNDHTAPLYGTGELPRLPDIQAHRDHWEITSYAVEPGDLVIFHPALLHGGAPAFAGRQRRTLSLRYFGEDATVSMRPNDTPELLEKVARREHIHPMQKAKLAGEGAPFRHPGFPKVHPSPTGSPH